MSRILKVTLLALVVCALVTDVRGEAYDEEGVLVEEGETEPVVKTPPKMKANKTATGMVAKTQTTSAKDKSEGPIAGVTEASAARIYMHAAIRDYVTLSSRFGVKQAACALVASSSGLPGDIVIAHQLITSSDDDSVFLKFHNAVRDVSFKQAKEIKCEEEAKIFWNDADILANAIVNAHRDIIREVTSGEARKKFGETPKSEKADK